MTVPSGIVPKVVGILGGGISGLSTAYYIRKKFGDSVQAIIFEKSNRVGGWIESTSHSKEVYLEKGPRSFRPVGYSGLNCLDLIEEIGLDDKVLFITNTHPAAKNRSIFTKGALVKIPTDLSILFKAKPPFERAIIRALVKDIFASRFTKEDDSIYNFIERRFGSDLAAYGIDPLIRGICAGDARKISVKFLLHKLFELEKSYGSVSLGFLLHKYRNKTTEFEESLKLPGYKGFGLSKIATTAVRQNWTIWGLERGTETLVTKLEQVLLKDPGVRIVKNTSVDSLKFPEEKMRSVVSGKVEVSCSVNGVPSSHPVPVDYIVSTIPSWSFAKILQSSFPNYTVLTSLLNTIHGVDVRVTNLVYENPYLITEPGFGFLVPSNEVKFTPAVGNLLGVVYDSCAFEQGSHTVLTVMSKGNESVRTDKEVQDEIQSYLKLTLGLTESPSHFQSQLSVNCIPQYTVGHYEKVGAAKRFLKAAKIPLLLSGASYEGVSVNDCIYSGRRAAENLPFSEP